MTQLQRGDSANDRAARLGLTVDPETSVRLGRIRQKDTGAEQLVRNLLHRLGYRFRVGGRGLPGRPDVVNQSKRWAVLVNGCFWHAHAGCVRATVPKRNRNFWVEKFRANRARDKRVLHELRELGFEAVVVWECEIEERPAIVVRRFAAKLGHARGKRASYRAASR